jgi:DNA-binding NtrC family response regulator
VITAQDGPSGAVAGRPVRRMGTVLLVDDEPEVRRTTERILKRLGFEVVCASSGGEAVELFRARRDGFALVVTDLTMPGMDGVALGTAIRALSHDVPMILITGYGAVRGPSQLFAGALAKPFTVDHLGAVVRQLLPA